MVQVLWRNNPRTPERWSSMHQCICIEINKKGYLAVESGLIMNAYDEQIRPLLLPFLSERMGVLAPMARCGM